MIMIHIDMFIKMLSSKVFLKTFGSLIYNKLKEQFLT